MYNEEAVVPFLRSAVAQFVSELPSETEVVLVNDGSTDSTLRQIVEWAKQDARVKVVNFSRNFGHQIALTAGLDYATGDAVVTLDADLQHPLNVIHRMIERYCEGYDVVYGQRKVRPGETWLKKFTAWLFYRLMRAFIHRDLPVDSGDFRLLSRPCLNGLQQMRETHRFVRGMVAWVGFPQIAVQYEQAATSRGQHEIYLEENGQFCVDRGNFVFDRSAQGKYVAGRDRHVGGIRGSDPRPPGEVLSLVCRPRVDLIDGPREHSRRRHPGEYRGAWRICWKAIRANQEPATVPGLTDGQYRFRSEN